MAVKDRVEAVLNVGLRVPSIMLLDVLYRWDVSSFFQKIQRSSLSNNPLFQYKYLALYLHYVGQCWCHTHTHNTQHTLSVPAQSSFFNGSSRISVKQTLYTSGLFCLHHVALSRFDNVTL